MEGQILLLSKENTNMLDVWYEGKFYFSFVWKFTKFTLDVWFTVVKKCNLEREIKTFLWIAGDSSFKPGIFDARFKQWINKGITAISTITEVGKIQSFQKMKRPWLGKFWPVLGLTGSRFFRKRHKTWYFRGTKQNNGDIV